MVISHTKLDLSVNINPLKAALANHSDLFGKFDWRRRKGSPHKEMRDIWLRYNDSKPYVESGDFTHFNDEHKAVWYDTLKDLPEVLEPIFDVMDAVQGEQLGMVLITKLPAGGKIYPHTDAGWHADYYDKYYVPINNKQGSSFYFHDGVIDSPDEGSVWKFDNSNLHWVNNDSVEDRIAMIICIKSRGVSCQQDG